LDEDKFTQCPYKSICECPGYDKDEGDWIPIDGFIRKEEGVLCLDWNILIPFEDIPRIRIPEGRHIADSATAADKIDEARRRWNRSEKRKEAQRRYMDSGKGKLIWKKFTETEKFKLALQKYHLSEKGQAALQRRADKVKDFRLAASWLEEHPGMTYEDYLNS